MKNSLFLLSFCFVSLSFYSFETEIKNAVKELKSERATILDIKKTSATEGAEALAVVFPEVIRWSAFEDLIETKADELLYVNKGHIAANLSIGHFQMQPRFIEQLEEYITANPNVSTFNYVVIREKNAKESRKLRMERMKQFAWQVRYAHVFWLVAYDRFRNRTFKTRQERIHFFATAYNYGFMKPENEIEVWQKRKCFPHGSKYKGEQTAFGDIAVEFFEKYSAEFEK
jgi:hypothetical protein